MKIQNIFLFALIAAFLVACSDRSTPVFVETQSVAALSTQNTASTDTAVPATSTATPTTAPTATITPTKKPTATLPPKDYGPTNFPKDVNPITGLVVEDPTNLDRRPVSVKIQMFPRGQRPPWGISLADVVFDYYQNNGLTRLHAIFYSKNAEQAGPVRSARLFDGVIVNMFKTIMAFGGADSRILEKLYSTTFANRLIVEGSGNCPPMCRIDPNQYNFLVVDTEELSKYADEKGIDNERQNLDGMKFEHETPDGGQAGTQVINRYSISSYNRWDYDTKTGRYLRSQDTQEDTGQGEAFAPLIDQLTNEQAAAENVVVLFVPHETIYRSNSGNSEIIEIKLTHLSSGTGYAFRDGQVYQIKWARPNLEGPLAITLSDGSSYPFKPGVTWFEVMGQYSKQTVDNGVWRFTFGLP